MATTTVFRPNALSTDVAYDALQGYRRATVAGVSRESQDVFVEVLSNETVPPWNADQRDTFVAAARSIATGLNYRARAMFRFVLRDYTVDASSIVSGAAPEYSWWPNVTAARLVWWNGDQGGLQGITPRLVEESSLLVRVGRGLYTPLGGFEQPFGVSTGGEVGATFSAATTFGRAEATIAWGDWAVPSRSWKTLTLSSAALDDYLRTITGPTDDYLDVSFVLDQEGVDGVDISREFGAWEPKPPSLEVDFDVDTGRRAVVAVRQSGIATASTRSGVVVAAMGDGVVATRRMDGKVVTVRYTPRVLVRR